MAFFSTTPSPRQRFWIAVAGVAVVASAATVLQHLRAARETCSQGDHAACAMPGVRPATADTHESELPAGPAVVELTSEACPACRRMEPVLRDARAQCAAAGASVVDLDVESIAGGSLATRLQVTETPTLVLFDAAHHEVARLSGARSLAEVRQAIEQAYGIACAAAPSAPRSSGG